MAVLTKPGDSLFDGSSDAAKIAAALGPAEVIVNGQRYVRETTLFAAMERVDRFETALVALFDVWDMSRPSLPVAPGGPDDPDGFQGSEALTRWLLKVLDDGAVRGETHDVRAWCALTLDAAAERGAR